MIVSPDREPRSERMGEPIRVVVPDYVYPLMPAFLENRRDDIAAIEQALAGSDYATIQLLGHRMKGDGGSYGLDRISEIGARLEQAARDEAPQAVRRHVEELEDFLARLEVIKPRQ